MGLYGSIAGKSKDDDIKDFKEALKIAAEALSIASDGMPDVQVSPPKEWELKSDNENVQDGWCSTIDLARKLRKMSL